MVTQTAAALGAQQALANELRQSLRVLQEQLLTLGRATDALSASVGDAAASSNGQSGESAAAAKAALAAKVAQPAPARGINDVLAELAGAAGDYAGKEDEALTLVLGRTSNPDTPRELLRTLCSALDPDVVFDSSKLRVSQPVLLSLMQQLGASLPYGGLGWKLRWLRAAALTLNAHDKHIAPHVAGILGALLRTLDKESEKASKEDRAELKVLVHIVNSVLLSATNK